MPAPRPGSAQLQSELGLGSQHWKRRKLLGKTRALPQARSLTFAWGSPAKKILNFRRLDLAEVNLSPSLAI